MQLPPRRDFPEDDLGVREISGVGTLRCRGKQLAIVGIGLGLSLKGIKSMVEMQFADFVTCGFNQIVNNLAKIHWRWGQTADIVIRMPTGGGSGACREVGQFCR